MSRVYLLGGAQTDFARHYSREGEKIGQILEDAIRPALEEAEVSPAQIGTAHVGNFTGELFAAQGQLGGLLAGLYPEWSGLPTARHEAACASGSVALLSASAEIEAGRYDLALVVGVEQMRNVDGVTAAKHLAVAAEAGESPEATYLWPAQFSALANAYAERFGLEREHLVHIARTNLENARSNPVAQTRSWELAPESFGEDEHLNPVIEGRIRKQDCARITDGAAALLLASEAAAAEHAKRAGISLSRYPYIEGWGHRSAPIRLDRKLSSSREGGWVFPELRGTLEDAWRRAGIGGVEAVDCLEVHDCFTITEYAILDHLGVGELGRPFAGLEPREIERGGRLPINPSGGLIGAGHPVGASGVRMLLDAMRQVRGEAGGCQVEGVKRAQTLNLGGSATTCVSFVVRAEA